MKGKGFNMIGNSPVGVDALVNLMNKVTDYNNSRFHGDHDRDINFDLWKILSALRGPDGGSDELKDKYTGPIRAWVSQEWNKSVGSITDSKVLTLSEFQDLKDKIETEQLDGDGYKGMSGKAFNHYVAHVSQALDVIIKIECFKELKKEKAFTDEMAQDK